MEGPTIYDLFFVAKEGKWVILRNLISDEVLRFDVFLKKDPDSNDFTILHHACLRGDRESALTGVCEIFNALKSYEYTSDQLFNFVNQKDGNGRTALHIVLEKDCSNVEAIKLLLNNGADVNAKTFSDIQKKYRRLVLTLFDRGLTLKKNRDDLENEELWSLECDFREINGYESKWDEENRKYRESEQLATILDHPDANQTDILGHPLVQLFLIAKRKRFQILIWFSIFCHILWTILSANYITCNITSFSTDDSSNESRSKIDLDNWNQCNFSFISYSPIFGLSMLIKGITELFLTRSKWFYVKQAENAGQWLILIIVTFVTFLNFAETMDNFRRSGIFIAVCLIGLVSSLILIQAQFTKIETLGIYQQLMTKGFWKILKLLLVFSPLLATYLLLFKFLMPANTSYNINWGLGIGKILAGMTGELNYDELFEDESVEKMISEYAVKAILILFIITIVILFQNMLIALSFDDIERLKAKATVAHLATTLEVIYLMEAFLMHDILLDVFQFFKVKDKVVQHFCVNELKSESKNNSEQTKVEVNSRIKVFGCCSYRYCCRGGCLAQSSPECRSSPTEEIPLQQNTTPIVPIVDSGQQTTKHEFLEQKFIGLPRKLRELIKDRAENEKIKVIYF